MSLGISAKLPIIVRIDDIYEIVMVEIPSSEFLRDIFKPSTISSVKMWFIFMRTYDYDAKFLP
jgi:hypothetical protein